MAETKVIAVSDVHLGSEKSESREFSRFIEEYVKEKRPEHLVLCGDILELSTRDMANAILENEQILTQLQDLQRHDIKVHYKVHYIVGNHDIIILDIHQQYFPPTLKQYFPFDVTKDLRLQVGSKNYYFRHGYELEVWLSPYKDIEMYENLFKYMGKASNVEGMIARRAWDFFQAIWSRISVKSRTQRELKRDIRIPAETRVKRKIAEKIDRLACSDVLNMFVPIARDQIFIFGHTHRPFLAEKAANLGSWHRSKKHKYNSYITIDDTGQMTLSYF